MHPNSSGGFDPEASRSRCLLIQFAKWPEPGCVKTRLIPALGEAGALEAHIVMTRAVLAQLLATGLPVQFWWNTTRAQPPAEAADILGDLQKRNIAQHHQPDGDLGRRMQAALESGLREAGRVIIVGSDCPSVDAPYLAEAEAALDGADVVLGPAEDGGFVLIGVRRTRPDMLRGITWGDGDTLRQTLARLEGEGMTIGLLSSRWDVDELVDWERFLALGGSASGV